MTYVVYKFPFTLIIRPHFIRIYLYGHGWGGGLDPISANLQPPLLYFIRAIIFCLINKIYTASQKNIPDIFSYNSRKH